MPLCEHTETEAIGEQKTDYGVNKYIRCKVCGVVLVVTPGMKIFAVGVNQRTR